MTLARLRTSFEEANTLARETLAGSHDAKAIKKRVRELTRYP